MKKIIKNRGIQIGVVLVAIILLVLLCLFNKYDENVVTRATKVLWAKYYNVECINEKCKYVVAYKGKKNGKSTIKIINSKGKTIGKYKDTYSKEDEYRYKPIDATNRYIILGNKKDNSSANYGYKVVTNRGKEILKTDNSVASITDNYFYEVSDDLYTIYNYKGTPLYKDVKELSFYNKRKIISFDNNGELTIIDKNSNRILNGYSIKEEVKEDNRTLYLIVEDNEGGFYYFDVNDNKIVGDSFVNYAILSNKKLILYKKVNNENKRYLYSIDGKEEKELSSKTKLYEELVKDIGEDYQIVDDTIISPDQKGLLVKNIKDNSLGTYEILSKKYEKLYNFKDYLDAVYEDKILTIYSLYEDENSEYLQVGCSLNYCDEENIIIYNPVENTVVFKSNNEKEIKKYRQYENNYKVVMYTDKTYTLFNENNEELASSKYDILVIDQKVIFGDSSDSELLLYSSKDKKLLNEEKSLAVVDNNSNYKIYEYTDEDSLYLYGDSGKLIKIIPIESSSISIADKYILYMGKNTANVINLIDNSEITYELTGRELVNDIDSLPVVPYKGSILITDYENENIKVMNFNKKVIKKIKNAVVNKTYFDQENNAIFLITKHDKNYGLYIIK